MDIVKIQSLIKDKKTVGIGDIDTRNSYIQIGVYQTGNRKNSAGNADSYSPYAIPIAEIIGGGSSYITSLTTVGDGGASTIIGGNLNIPVYQTMIPHLGFDNTNKTIWNNGPGAILSNVSFGENAFPSNLTGAYNTAIGNNALYVNTSGFHNNAIGYTTLFYNTVGTGNTAIGSETLFSNTTGSFNIAIGLASLINNTIGDSNIAIGEGALESNTVGNYNIAIGRRALLNNQSSHIIAIGTFALYSNTTGQNNTAIGDFAGSQNTTGIGNVFIGSTSGYNNTTANYNTCVGNGTITNNFTGSVILGSNAVATGNNQFVVGCDGINAGSVATESNISTQVWNVIINGVAKKILLA